MTDSPCDFGIDFHRKIDDFCSKKHSFLLLCRRRHRFDYKNHRFFDGNRSQNRMENQSKIINFLIYVGNVLSDVGKRGECMGTFLESYRLEKRSKSHGVSKNFITTGIPIQMNILCRTSLQLHFRQHLKRSRQVSSRQCKLKLSQTVQTQKQPQYSPKPHRRRAFRSQTKVFFIGFVTM